MIYAIAYYWICAGVASFKLDRLEGDNGLIALIFSIFLGGFAIPIRIMMKLAE